MNVSPEERNPKGHGGFGDHPEHINRAGRPRRPEVDQFREALDKIQTERGMNFFEFIINKAIDDPKYMSVLLEIIRKMLPSLQNVTLENFSLDMLAQVMRQNSKKKEGDK